eukprot:653174-Amphidinium_carterae.1
MEQLQQSCFPNVKSRSLFFLANATLLSKVPLPRLLPLLDQRGLYNMDPCCWSHSLTSCTHKNHPDIKAINDQLQFAPPKPTKCDW